MSVLSIRRVIAFVLLTLAGTSSRADAQRDEFFNALLPFYQSLAGVYGDEGAQLTAHLESLSAALSRWDRSLALSEAQQRARLRDADTRTALEVHTVLASLYAERSRFQDALREIEQDIRIDSSRAVFHRFQALVYRALNRPADAADALRAAFLIQPSDPLSAYHLITDRSSQTTPAELEQAVATLILVERELTRGQRRPLESPFLTLNATSDDMGTAIAFVPAAYSRGISLLLDGRFEDGVAELRQSVAADPLVADPISRTEPMARGIAALKTGRVEEAIEQMSLAQARAPTSAEAHRLLASAYAVAGHIEKSLEQLREAVRLNPRDERAWLALARGLDAAGAIDESAAVLRTASQTLPDSGALRWLFSAMAGKRQRTDDTDLQLIARAEQLVLLAGKGELYGRLARLAQGHLDYERGVELLERRVEATPNSAAAHGDLGRAYVEVGNEENGYAELIMSLLIEPANVETLSAIGRLHFAAARYPEAVESFEKAVARSPRNLQAVHGLAEALIRAGRQAEGEQKAQESERLRLAINEDQRRFRIASRLALEAELSTRAGDYDRAIAAWREVIALVGDDSTYYLGMAEAFAAAKRFEDAAEHYRKAISLKAGPEAHRQLATVYAALGRVADSARERQAYTERRLSDLRERSSGTTVTP